MTSMRDLKNKTPNVAHLEDDNLFQLVLYGPPKTRKTWTAGTAAEAGFNVILLDADRGSSILTQNLSDEALSRIQLFKIHDKFDGALACKFITTLFAFGEIYWNPAERQIVTSKAQINPTTQYLSIKKHFDKNTVLIIDSYTALVNSLTLQYAEEQNIDLSDAEQLGWDGYGWSGMLATWMIEKFTKQNCHLIMVGHETSYEKYDSEHKNIILSRLQMKSTSHAHALTITDKFQAILRFYNLSPHVTKISTTQEKDIDSGSRTIKPGIYDWKELTIKKICSMTGVPLPSSNLPLLDLTFTGDINKIKIKTKPEGGTKTPSKTANIKIDPEKLKSLKKHVGK